MLCGEKKKQQQKAKNCRSTQWKKIDQARDAAAWTTVTACKGSEWSDSGSTLRQS